MPPSRRNADGGFAALWRRRGPLACLLFPFSSLFRILVAMRRGLYRIGLLRSERMPVPVVIVGNITVGGSGKTPLVIHLALGLRKLGRRPGIVSRGYRGGGAGVTEVLPGSDPAVLGDEPVLLARRSGCPVFVGRDRPAAARALLAAHPECDLILADDGLQHYRLQRDVELAVFDHRGVMNGWCLPAGPLREPVARLSQVDAVVINGSAVTPAPTVGCPLFRMNLLGDKFHRLDDPQIECNPADLAGRNLHAVAGIGAPERFFEQLRTMGLSFTAHSFPDHHDFCAADLDYAGNAILTTEKDAVKLAQLSLPLPVWVLPVTAEVTPDLAAFVLEKLNGRPSA
ncbi:MAG: tetraacyldisaccharide 4'-kinase [Sulfuritalea sp.]|nr:tetraacyldisaccharide 4'-kinase [Sulfuritalea sp.]